jgi:hypothetical protein
MCSQLLRQWKRERMKSITNSGAPDHAGIRSESWQETHMQPTAFFRLQPRRKLAWKPDMTLTSEQIQERMNMDLDWMTLHATTQRDRLVFMILRETGARLSEILTMTAGGYHKAKDPYQTYVTNKGSYGREEKLLRLTPPIEAERRCHFWNLPPMTCGICASHPGLPRSERSRTLTAHSAYDAVFNDIWPGAVP